MESDGPNSRPGEATPGSSERAPAVRAHSTPPGHPGDIPPPAAPRTDLRSLLAALSDSAQRETSAAGKARTLLVSSDLHLWLGEQDKAEAAARQAADSAPKMAVTAAQARALEVDEPESAARRLETIMRLTEHEPSRTHAALLLYRELVAQGESHRASAVLDHVARAGSRDPRVQIERLLGRLTRREPLSGLQLEGQLQTEAEVLSELLGGGKSAVLRPALLYFRVARELRAGRLSDALQLLADSPIEGERKRELLSAHLARRPGGRAASVRLLREEATDRPTRSVLRALAARCLEAGDRATLGALLQEQAAGSTWTADERHLLQALIDSCSPTHALGEPGTGVEDSLLGQALRFEAHRAGAPLAAGLWSETEDEGAEIRRFRLGQRLGARLASRTPGGDQPPPSLATELLELFEQRPELAESTLQNLLRLATAARQGEVSEVARALARLSPEPGFRGLAAMLLEAAGSSGEAEDLYRGLEEGAVGRQDAGAPGLSPDALAQLASRALGELAGQRQSGTEHALGPAELFEELARDPLADDARQDLSRSSIRALRLAGALLELARDPKAWLHVPPVLAAPFGSLPLEHTPERGPSPDSAPGADHAAPVDASGIAELELVMATASGIVLSESDPEAAAAELERLGRFDPALQTIAGALTERPSAAAASSSAWGGWATTARALLSLDYPEALARLSQVNRQSSSPLARRVEEFLFEWTGDLEQLSHRLLDRAQQTAEPFDRVHLYSRLASLEWERQSPGAALLFQRSILELFPDHLPALLWVEDALLREGHVDEWRTLQSQIRASLEKEEPESEDASVYRLVSAYMALGRFDHKLAERELLPLLSREAPPLVALRFFEGRAREQQDDGLLGEVSAKLLPHAHTDLDRAATCVQLALCAARAGRPGDAVTWLQQAREVRPEDFTTELLALHLLSDDAPESQAEAVESLARSASHPKHRARIYRTAGALWEAAADSPRARDCYERCLELHPSSQTAQHRLRALYQEAGEKQKLRDLLTAQLGQGVAPDVVVEWELELAALLTELGAAEEAKTRLDALLGAHGSNISLLRAHADVSAALGKHQDALTSLTSLAKRLGPGAERCDVLRSLGRLYEHQFGALERAMDTYEAVLADEPDDAATARRLVDIYRRLGLAERATSLLTRLIQKETAPDEKKKDALYLAELYETLAGDNQRASATLERTRRAWPLDADVLGAVYGFMNRQGQQSGARMLIARAGKEVERKLEEGHIDPQLLDTLAEVRLLSGQQEEAALIRVTRAAYVGEESRLTGAGPRALDPALEDLLAPEALAYPLRTLLRKTARALDAAFPIDVAALGAQPSPPGRVLERLKGVAAGLGQPTPELFVAEALGARAAPLTVQPSRLIVGTRMADLEDEVIDFLLLRTLKMQQLGGGALSRSRAEDGWPMLVALLHIFAPTFRPAQVDARKVAQARALVEQGLGRVGYDDDVPTLVLETIGSLGQQGQDLVDSPRRLANRAALLATGGPGLALQALAAGGARPLPETGPSRFRFVTQTPEARDVLLFSTTDRFAAARKRLGLPSAQGTQEESLLIPVTEMFSPDGAGPPPPPRRPG